MGLRITSDVILRFRGSFEEDVGGRKKKKKRKKKKIISEGSVPRIIKEIDHTVLETLIWIFPGELFDFVLE